MHPAIVQRAVFLGAVALGASFAARATPPCPTREELHFDVDVARIDGASQDIKNVALGSLSLLPQDDEGDIFVANTYDPDTGRARNLELRSAP